MTKRIIVLEFRQLIILFSNINFLAAICRIRIRLHNIHTYHGTPRICEGTGVAISPNLNIIQFPDASSSA